MKTLILGGVRSGKSRLAETMAQRTDLPVTYIATATAEDAEMRRRIDTHRARRPAAWTTVEAPRALAAALEAHAAPRRCLVVDCLTLWLTNLLMIRDAERLAKERDALLQRLPAAAGEIILVSNETGLGVIPLGALTRRFGEEAGLLHQALARCCERVVLTVAGLPLALKGPPV